MSTAEAIAKLRKKLGYTQQQFADALGVTVVTISRYENGREPAGNVLQRLTGLAAQAQAKHLQDLFTAKLRSDVASGVETLPSAGTQRRVPKFYFEMWMRRQGEIFRASTGLMKRDDLTASERKTVLEGIRGSAEKSWNEMREFLAETVPALNPNEDFSPRASLTQLFPVDWMGPLYNPRRHERKDSDEIMLAVEEILAIGSERTRRVLKSFVIDEVLEAARRDAAQRESKKVG
jgi:transcriptional regulator with XRE-family HTH domain